MPHVLCNGESWAWNPIASLFEDDGEEELTVGRGGGLAMATPSIGPDVCSRDPRADRWTGEPAEIQSILSHTLLGILFHCAVALLDTTFCSVYILTLIISHVISRLRVLICWAALGPRLCAKPSGTSSGEYWSCWCPLISGWGRSSGGGHGNSLQYS